MMKRTLWTAGLLAAAACTGAGAPDDFGRRAQEQIMANQLTIDQLLNTLTGTVEALDALAGSSLSSATFASGSVLGPLLIDHNARAFMHHLVGCALAPGQTVSWLDPSNELHAWEGVSGLCPAWASGAPSIACQELVSACLLAKNNAYGRRVTVSMRGDDLVGTALPLADEVEARTYVEYSHGLDDARVSSFDDCALDTAGAKRDCGWPEDLAFVGRCTPDPFSGATVTVGAGAPAPDDCDGSVLGSASGGLVMRVCEGVSGCNDDDALASSEGACNLPAPALSFVCPKSGIFTVMLAPWQSDDQSAGGVAEVEDKAGAILPGAEEELFQVREGAFYGNLFDSSALSPDVSVYLDPSGRPVREVRSSAPIVVFEDLWACHSPGFYEPYGYLHERLCATGEEATLCAATVLGSCEKVFPRGPVATRCDPALDDLGYRVCRDGNGTARSRVITAVLKDACDMLPPGLFLSCMAPQ